MAVDSGDGHRYRVDAGRLWAGGGATTLVCGLIVLVGVLITRGVFDVPVLSPTRAGTLGDGTTGAYVLAACAAAVLATALLYLLMLATPQPERFFQWVVGLVTLAAVVLPFTTDASWQPQLATAVINLVIGAAILTLLTSVARTAVRRVGPRRRSNDPRYPRDPRHDPRDGADDDTLRYPTYPERRDPPDYPPPGKRRP